jgi:CRP-like cAMP-binding protein
MDKKSQAIDMKMFAKNAGANMSFPAGSIIFKEGDVCNCVYILQSGVVEIVTHDKVADTCGPGDVMGFMLLIDGGPNTASARVKETAELSIIDERKFHFMIDEVPNFAFYIMKALAHRVRGMREKI